MGHSRLRAEREHVIAAARLAGSSAEADQVATYLRTGRLETSESAEDEVLPYNPAVIEALAKSDKLQW